MTALRIDTWFDVVCPGPGAHEAVTGRLTAIGAAEGIEFRFDRAQRVNTFDAHRLIPGAQEVDTSVRVLERAVERFATTDPAPQPMETR